MQSLYQIVKAIQQAQGSLAKQALLNEHKDNALFRAYMKAVYDVGINYYTKKLPKVSAGDLATMDQSLIDWMLLMLAQRRYTGNEAAAAIKQVAASLDSEGQELMQYVLDRSIGAGVGDTMVLKTWPDLYFLPPYQRCSLLDAKARERFGKLKRFYVQTKADGMFAYVVKRLDGTVDVITRQGSKFPQWFAEKMAEGLEAGKVLVGELMVDEKIEGLGCQELDRKTANGLLNSALKDGDTWDEFKYGPRMVAWDMLTQEEFEAGKSSRPYEQRWEEFQISGYISLASRVSLIPTWEVSSLAEAFVIYAQHTANGLEGCIIKDPASLWKDGTAKDMVKLKIKFQVEMRCTGIYEGTGKYKGMMGGGYFQSEDGGIENEAGSGFDDKQRKAFWEHPELIVNAVCMLEANDITQSRDSRKKPSLSLPIFCEVRSDKATADSTERIYAQLEAAKSGA